MIDYLKWQEIPAKAKATGGVLSVFVLLLGILNLAGMDYTIPQDKFCVECYIPIYVNSSVWEIKVEHAGLDKDILFAKVARSRTRWVNLDKISEFINTNATVPAKILVPTIKRYSTIKHHEFGYLRPIKDGDQLIERKNKYNPDGDWFVIYIEVPDGKTIKFGMDLEYWLMEDIGFDPLVISPFVCDFETIYYEERVPYNVLMNYTTNFCSDAPINKSCEKIYHFYNLTKYNIIKKSKEVCAKKKEVKVGTDVINYNKWDIGGCHVIDNKVHCLNQYDGWDENARCIEGNGKSCCRYDGIEDNKLVEEYCHFDVGRIELG